MNQERPAGIVQMRRQAGAAILLGLCLVPGSAHADTLASLGNRIRESEQRYTDIECLSHVFAVRQPKSGNAWLLEPGAGAAVVRIVRSGGRFVFERYGGLPDGNTEPYERYAFDGESTRVLRKFLQIDVFDSRRDDFQSPVPHEWLLSGCGLPMSLADLLSAGQQAAEGAEIRELDPKSIDGVECLGLQFELKGNGDSGDRSRVDVWLAESRNLLPVRINCYDDSQPGEEPVTTGTLSDLTEISEGVWLAKTAVITWHGSKSRSGASARSSGSGRQLQLVDVRTDPPESLIRTPKPADLTGVKISEWAGDSIAREYTPDNLPPEPNFLSAIESTMLVNVGFLVLFGCLYLVRRRGRSE